MSYWPLSHVSRKGPDGGSHLEQTPDAIEGRWDHAGRHCVWVKILLEFWFVHLPARDQPVIVTVGRVFIVSWYFGLILSPNVIFNKDNIIMNTNNTLCKCILYPFWLIKRPDNIITWIGLSETNSDQFMPNVKLHINSFIYFQPWSCTHFSKTIVFLIWIWLICMHVFF